MKSASHVFVSTLGACVGLIGIEHGIGEILQGTIQPPGMIFPSWPESAFFLVLGGEPAFSILPDMLFTGILACGFSLAYIVWSVFFADSRNSLPAMLGLSILMFFTGAGIFPPFFAVYISFAARRLTRPSPGKSDPSSFAQSFLRSIWPWPLWLTLVFWLAMVPGVPAINYFAAYTNNAINIGIFIGMAVFLFGADLSSRAYDQETELVRSK